MDMEMIGTFTAINTFIVTAIGVLMAIAAVIVSALIYRLNKMMTKDEIQAKFEARDARLVLAEGRLTILEGREWNPELPQYHSQV